MKIFEINKEIRHLEFLLETYAEEHDGDITGCPHTGLIENLEGDKEENLLFLAGLIKEIEADIEAQKNAVKNINIKAKRNQNKVDFFKSVIKDNINKGQKLKNELHSISWRKSESVLLDLEPECLPVEYQKTKIDADQTKIKADIKSGKTIIGACVVENQNLQIK